MMTNYKFTQWGPFQTYQREPYEECPHCKEYQYTLLYDVKRFTVETSCLGLFQDVEWQGYNYRYTCLNCQYEEDATAQDVRDSCDVDHELREQ